MLISLQHYRYSRELLIHRGQVVILCTALRNRIVKKNQQTSIKTTRPTYNRRARIVSCCGPPRPYRRRRRRRRRRWRVAIS